MDKIPQIGDIVFYYPNVSEDNPPSHPVQKLAGFELSGVTAIVNAVYANGVADLQLPALRMLQGQPKSIEGIPHKQDAGSIGYWDFQ